HVDPGRVLEGAGDLPQDAEAVLEDDCLVRREVDLLLQLDPVLAHDDEGLLARAPEVLLGPGLVGAAVVLVGAAVAVAIRAGAAEVLLGPRLVGAAVDVVGDAVAVAIAAERAPVVGARARHPRAVVPAGGDS